MKTPFERKSIWALIGLTIITLGLYQVFWFINRTDAINKFSRSEKLNKNVFIAALVLVVISLVLDIYSGFSAETIKVVLNNFSGVFQIVGSIIIIVQAFTVRKIFNDKYEGKKGIHFNAFWTFFLTYIYLQYKINEISEM